MSRLTSEELAAVTNAAAMEAADYVQDAVLKLGYEEGLSELLPLLVAEIETLRTRVESLTTALRRLVLAIQDEGVSVSSPVADPYVAARAVLAAEDTP